MSSEAGRPPDAHNRGTDASEALGAEGMSLAGLRGGRPRALVACLAATVLLGFDGGVGVGAEAQEAQATDGATGLRLLGHKPDRRRAIVALWALHPFEPQFPEADWTGGVGVQFSQWFAATFVNSYDVRSWIVGVERNWWEARSRWLGVGVGYRAGLVTGYDERLLELAGQLPAMPFVGLLVWTRAGPVTFDVAYVYRAIALEASVLF